MDSDKFDSDVLISVIITTFNRPHFIRKAIENVMNQSYKNIEIIVIDDNGNGTQHQTETFQAISNLLPTKIKYFANDTNIGACASRNAGAKVAKGTFIAFFDDDDVWMPEKLELQLMASTNQTGLIYCYQEARDAGDGHVHFETKFSFGEGFCPGAFTDISRGSIAVPNPLISKQAFSETGGFDERMPSCQDIDLFARIALKFHITLVPKVLHNAIIHSAERISTNHRKKLDGYIRFYQKHNGYMSDSGKCYLFDRIVFHAFWLNEKSIANKYHILRCEIQNPSIKYSIFYMGTLHHSIKWLIKIYFQLRKKKVL